MPLKLIFPLFLLTNLCHFLSTEFVPRIDCSTVTNVYCQCSLLHEFMVGSFRSFVELECVQNSKRVSIKNERNEVSVTCDKVGGDNLYHLLPSLNINVIRNVEIKCPMSVGTTIKNFTDHMGINGFDHLKITIDRLSGNLFKDPLNITKLDVILVQSALEFFPTKFLYSLRNLESFSLTSLDGSGSSLIETCIFYSQSRLKKVQLSDVVVTKLNKDIFVGAASIVDLHFQHSMIELLMADAFENLPELTTVRFHFTRIASLPDSLFRRNPKLENFYSKSNAIISGGLLANLTSLKTVDISQCQSLMTDNLFAGSFNIEMISLNHIDLRTISSHIFRDQIELMELDLSYTALISLSDTVFQTNTKLIKLNLGFNDLKMIPLNLFASTEHLKELNLEFNEIQQISDDILPVNLNTLRLNGNKLKTMDERILHRLNDNTGELTYLFIERNAFVCECGSTFLRLAENLYGNSVECQDEQQTFLTINLFLDSCPLLQS